MPRKPRQQEAIDREQALSGRPVRLPFIRREPREDGGMKVTVRFDRPGWQRRLGATGDIHRTFGMDPYGREVYEACNGEADVRAIVKEFARRHRISVAEAEVSVTAFLRTLVTKGLVAIRVREPQP